MKRIVACWLGMIMLLSVLEMVTVIPTSAQIQMADEFGVEDAMGNPNTYVVVPVNITNVQNGPIQTLMFDVSYNDSVIELTKITNGDLTPLLVGGNLAWTNIILGVNKKSIMLNTPNQAYAIPNGSSGSVVLLNFSVKNVSGATSPMNMSNIGLSSTSLQLGTAPAKDGTFRVDAGAPSVTNPEANPDTIEADGVQETRLNVTVVDDSSEDVVVTVDLTQLGGPAAKVMEKIDDALFSTMTNATPGTPPGTYNLSINATDVLGNYNNTENFTLTVALPPTGSVMGTTVYTCNGTGIADVAVNLTQNGSAIAAAMTDGGGNYTFTDITPDDYYVNASKLRFWSNSTTVTVTAGGTVTADMALWMKGDLDNDCKAAGAVDVTMMIQASVGDILGDWRFDLNNNDNIADAVDVTMMIQASVGDIILI